MKRILRNRELSRAFELKTAEVSTAQNQLVKLHVENQSLMLELNQLRACSNMKDIEQEVERRVTVSTDQCFFNFFVAIEPLELLDCLENPGR